MNLSGDWAEVVDHLNSATKGPIMKREPVLIIAAIKAVILCAVGSRARQGTRSGPSFGNQTIGP